jgi:hypothetical protein
MQAGQDHFDYRQCRSPDEWMEEPMKKIAIWILCAFLVLSFAGCGGSASEGNSTQKETAQQENTEQDQNSTDTAVSANPAAEIPAEIPGSLIFADDGSGQYKEPFLGEWEGFLKKVFKDYESGEVDPGSGITKYFGEGNDGYGYCFLVTTRSSDGEVISYNIDTAIVSESPNAGGDEVSGQTMVQWMYENFAGIE